MFTGPSAFDKHQALPEGGPLTCHSPGTRGLVVRVVNGLQVWGWPLRGDGSWVTSRSREVVERSDNLAC